MSKKILVIEDERNVATFIGKGLREAGHEIFLAYDGPQGLERLAREEIDLVILDIVLPAMDGRLVAKKIRELGYKNLPIIMLTALGTTENVVEGLDSGADDYLVKPFKFKELLARIRALSRRHVPMETVNRKLTVSDLELDRDAKTVKRAGNNIKLTSTEFRLLEFFLRNKNRVLSRIDILESVWDINFNLGTNVVDVYVNYLRNKIDRPYGPRLIHTVIGMGYTLRESEEHED